MIRFAVTTLSRLFPVIVAPQTFQQLPNQASVSMTANVTCFSLNHEDEYSLDNLKCSYQFAIDLHHHLAVVLGCFFSHLLGADSSLWWPSNLVPGAKYGLTRASHSRAETLCADGGTGLFGGVPSPDTLFGQSTVTARKSPSSPEWRELGRKASVLADIIALCLSKE